ncbi:MAG: hypothetical protein ABI321_02195 [Polyangia bacterium]
MESRSLALTVGLVGSLALHALVLVGSVVVPFVTLSRSLPIEVVPFKPKKAAPPMAAPGGAPTAAPESKAVTKAARPGPVPSQKPKPPVAEDLRKVGPPGANITVILRLSMLRTSPHREGTEQLLSLLPDYHTLLDGTGLSLFEDLSALLISTPDPRDVAATFLAARHRRDPRFDQLARRPLGAGDPRRFRALSDDLMVLGQPPLLDALSADAESARPWLEALRTFDTRNEAALEVTIADLSLLVRIAGAPLPRSLSLAVSADPSPRIRLVCDFDEEGQAGSAMTLWPTLQKQVGLLAPIFAGALDELSARQSGRRVEIIGRLPERQVSTALSLAKLVAPTAPRLAPVPTTPDAAQ